MDPLWDVAVVGCGPAGATAALCLARQGVRVVAFDKQSFPREKVCGDGLMPDALRVLTRLGLIDRVRQRAFAGRRLMLYSPSHIALPIAMDALVLKRFDLDAIIVSAAAEAGAVIEHGRVENVSVSADRVSLSLGKGVVNARTLILATGADTRLLEQAGMVTRKVASGVAVRHYIQSKAVVDDLVVSFERELVPGYAWIFPMGNGEYNVGCGVVYRDGARNAPPLNDALQRFLRECEPARAIAEGMISATRVAGATLRSGLRGAAFARTPNVLAIGETIGCTLPVSGEGIGKAMETGEIAAAAIAAEPDAPAAEYHRRIAALQPKYAGYSAAQRWLARPWVNDTIARMARRSSYALRSFSEILDETTDPRAIFSARGMLRMVLG
ncbi:MAG TPA: geranylgeranyl reductase family protein [Thermoanaerobaculia bacterium]|nr:geranylgeranyl reductase family protein [Thermoanaerobaculia bacterium]